LVGCGYGSDADRSAFEREVEQVAARTESEGMQRVAEVYARGPTRVQFADKDPRGWQEFYQQLKASSTLGHTNMLRGVQKKRPSVRDLLPELRDLTVPTLIVTGDEDEPCLEPGLLMKRTIPAAALVVVPKTGHAVNLEEPEAFNRQLADFLAQVDAGRWRLRNPASLSPSALLPAAGREG
jgi:pimeloyl-ACP methyl ester carboxylesterase